MDDAPGYDAMSRAQLIGLLDRRLGTREVSPTDELRDVRERAEVLWRETPVGIIEATLDGVIISVNPALSMMLGHEVDDLIGTSMIDLMDLSDAPDVVVRGTHLAQSRTPGPVELSYRCSDGRSVPVQVSTAVLRAERGCVDRLTAFVVDVSDAHAHRAALSAERELLTQARLELAAREREARLHAMVSQVVDYAIIGLDSEGVVESWNEGAERLKGYPSIQAIGKHFSIFHTEEDRAAGLAAQLLDTARTKGRAEHKGWRVRADGRRFWADVVITALHDASGGETGFVKVSRDLSVQHELDVARESLFATVSHDLKTPITAIKLYAEMMADGDEETQTEYALRIAARADHLARLVNTLFDYAKMRAQPTTITLEPLSLAAVAKSCVDDIGPVLHDHPVTVDDSTLMAWADHTAMTRIVENLLTNAAKYSPIGTPIRIAFHNGGARVRVIVTDQGRGIAPEDIETIFVEFNRGRLAETDGGTGLGLASVQHLAVLQGGTAWLSSRLGQGTSVTIELGAVQPPSVTGGAWS